MPASEIFHKWKHGLPLSNGQKIQSYAQAKAIASQYGNKEHSIPAKKGGYGKALS